MRSLAVTSLGTEVTAQDVARLVVQQEVPPGISLAVAPNPASGLTFDAPLREARDIFEKSYLEHHIALEGGNMSRVADKVGLERTHLYRKIKQLGIRSRRSED